MTSGYGNGTQQHQQQHKQRVIQQSACNLRPCLFFLLLSRLLLPVFRLRAGCDSLPPDQVQWDLFVSACESQGRLCMEHGPDTGGRLCHFTQAK